MENYFFSNLCSWTEDSEIVCPMSPAYLIKPLREIMKGKFGGLTRVQFRGKFAGAYQMIETPGLRYPDTGFDTLLYKAIYRNAISIALIVDLGTGVECIAEMTKFTGEDSRVVILDPERDKKYYLTLQEDDLFVMFERVNSFIKINEKYDNKYASIAVQI